MNRLLLLSLVLLLPGCDPGVTPVVYDWSVLEDGPLPEFKYRYAGTAIEEGGKRYLYYCANIDRTDRPIISDHIVTRTAVRRPESGGWECGEERVAVWPGEVDDSGQRSLAAP